MILVSSNAKHFKPIKEVQFYIYKPLVQYNTEFYLIVMDITSLLQLRRFRFGTGVDLSGYSMW
jgi:hypothetical protein